MFYFLFKSFHCYILSIPHGIGKTTYPIAENNDFRTVGKGGVKDGVTVAEDEKIDFFIGMVGIVGPYEIDKVVTGPLGRGVATLFA